MTIMNGVARSEVSRVTDIAAKAPSVTKLCAVSLCAIKNVVVFRPAPDIQFLATTQNGFHVLKREGQFSGFKGEAGGNNNLNVARFPVWEVKSGWQIVRSEHFIDTEPEIACWRISAILPFYSNLPANDSVGPVILDCFPLRDLWKYKSPIGLNERVTAKSHLAASGIGGYASENESGQNSGKAEGSQPSLESSPPNSVFSRLGHAPLFAQVGSIVVLGALATSLVIIGLSSWWLDDRRWRGCSLLLLGLLGWAGGVVLCVAIVLDSLLKGQS
jgi:hypothetical protein